MFWIHFEQSQMIYSTKKIFKIKNAENSNKQKVIFSRMKIYFEI